MCRSGNCLSRAVTKSTNRSKAAFSSVSRERPVRGADECVRQRRRRHSRRDIRDPPPPRTDRPSRSKKMSPGDGCRQKRQAEPRHDRQQFMENLSRLPAFNLDARLFAHPLIGMAGTAIRLPGQRQRHGRKVADRRDGRGVAVQRYVVCEIPATRQRWSSARRRASHRACQRQMSQCSRGSGYRASAACASTKRSSVRRTCR